MAIEGGNVEYLRDPGASEARQVMWQAWSTMDAPTLAAHIDSAGLSLFQRVLMSWVMDAETNKRVNLVAPRTGLTKEAFNTEYGEHRVASDADPSKTVSLGHAAASRMFVVDGVRFRPDIPYVAYEDQNGMRFVNSWREPPRVPAGRRGIKEFHELLRQVFPDAFARERFELALAYKVQNPAERPNAVLSISPNDIEVGGAGRHGTGRGALFELLHRMYPGYVATVDYKTLTGQTSQSQYGDWRERSLFVCVDEIKDTSAEHLFRRSAAVAVGEQLKTLVEKRPMPRMHMKKGVANVVHGFDYFWLLLASNHIDAVALDPQDRRFEVSFSGDKQTSVFWRRIQAALEDPKFISAVWAHLKNKDVSAFDMAEHAPLTDDKRRVLATTMHPIDEYVYRVVEELARQGRYFEGPEIKRVARAVAIDEDEENIAPQLASAVKRAVRKSPSKIKLENRSIFVFDLETSKSNEPFDNVAARAELLKRRKNGNVGDKLKR